MKESQGFDLGKSLNQVLSYGNSRKLELYRPNGQRLFQVPLTVAVLAGVVALFAQLLVPLVLAAAVLLVLKFRFVLSRDLPREAAPPQPAHTQPSPAQPTHVQPAEPQPRSDTPQS